MVGYRSEPTIGIEHKKEGFYMGNHNKRFEVGEKLTDVRLQSGRSEVRIADIAMENDGDLSAIGQAIKDWLADNNGYIVAAAVAGCKSTPQTIRTAKTRRGEKGLTKFFITPNNDEPVAIKCGSCKLPVGEVLPDPTTIGGGRIKLMLPRCRYSDDYPPIDLTLFTDGTAYVAKPARA